MAQIIIISGTSFTVPDDWSNTNKIECIGGGAAGADGNTNAGGGGGAYEVTNNYAGTSARSVLTIQVGAGGAHAVGVGNPGTDTWWNGANLAGSTCGAKAGNVSAGTTGGAGGLSSGGVGSSGFSGGNGGNNDENEAGGSGGGGSGGPSGVGARGGNVTTSFAGSGGGGGGGGTQGTDTTGSGGTTGTAGGNNHLGSGGGAGGAPGSAGSPGSNGGGGGGGGAQTGVTTETGGVGGNGTDFTAGAGSGGGGGGGGSGGSGVVGSNGGNGGHYGGGGGGGGFSSAGVGSGGNGSQGVISVTYTTSYNPGIDATWFSALDVPNKLKTTAKLVGLAVALQVAMATPPPIVLTAGVAHSNEGQVTYRKRVQYQASTISFNNLGAPNSADRWNQPWSIPPSLIKRGLATHEQQSFTISTTALTADVTTEDRWHQAWSDPVRLKPGLSSRLHQDLSSVPNTSANATLVTFASVVEGQTTNRKRIQYQSIAFVPLPSIAIPSQAWIGPWSEPVRFLRLNTALQQPCTFIIPVNEGAYALDTSNVQFPRTFQFQAQSSIIPDFSVPNSEDRWHQAWSIPVKLSKPGIGAHLQQFFVISPAALNIPVIITADEWIYGWDIPIKLSKPGLHVSQHPFLAYSESAVFGQVPFSKGYIIC